MNSAKSIALGLRFAIATALIGLTGSIASAQQPPPPDGEPVSTDYTNSDDANENGTDDSPKSAALVVQAGYRSDALGGDFLAQWMAITLNGQSHPFWGARAISLDRDSPLRKLGLRAGDVVTRLDGTPIWNGMKKRRNVWQIPELEDHYGTTDVRYIKQGTQRVLQGQIVIDNFGTGNNGNNRGAPLAP